MSILLIIVIIETIALVVMAYKLSWTKYDGTMNVLEGTDKKTFSMELDSNPDDLDQKKKVVFKVSKDSG